MGWKKVYILVIQQLLRMHLDNKIKPVESYIYLESTVHGAAIKVPDALKQKTPNFFSAFAFHCTTPVLPFPHILSGVSRGTTATFSAVQPNL